MGAMLGRFGGKLARFLTKPVHVHGTGPTTRPNRLLASLRPADVLLVEGGGWISGAINYLTNST